MNNFRAITEPSTFEANDRGSLTGAIWMEIGGVAFPEANWIDFAIVILGWWCQTLFSLEKKDDGHGEFRFMDGPFLVSVSAMTNAELQLIKQAHGKQVGLAHRCKLQDVRRQVCIAAKICLNYCEQHGIHDRDVQALREGVEGLQADL